MQRHLEAITLTEMSQSQEDKHRMALLPGGLQSPQVLRGRKHTMGATGWVGMGVSSEWGQSFSVGRGASSGDGLWGQLQLLTRAL